MLTSLIHAVQNFTLWLVDTFGHLGIFVGMTIESACIPLPSEVMMLFGGFMSEAGKLNFWLVVTAGVSGNLLGSLVSYYLGKYGGISFISHWGRFIFLNMHHLKLAEQWFARYGSLTVFFGRVLPVVRTFISLPAGIGKMNIYKFIIYTIMGCIPWNLFLTWFGFSLGSHWQEIEKYIRPISYFILIVLMLAIVYATYLLLRQKKKQVK